MPNQIHSSLDAGSDVREFARQIVSYLRRVLLLQIGSEDPGAETPEIEAIMKEQSLQIASPILIDIIRIFNAVAVDTRSKWHPGLPLEIAFLEACELIGDISSTPRNQNPSPQPAPQTNPAPAKTPLPNPEPNQQRGEPNPVNDNRIASKINQVWPQVLSEVRKEQPNLYGLLNSCQSRYSTGSVLVLGFSSDILKNQMAKRENTELVERIASEVMGSKIEVRSTITSAKNTDIPPEVDGDGMVASALRDMGGEIVDIQ